MLVFLQIIYEMIGYITLFPLMLQVLPEDSPSLGRILQVLTDPQVLWSK